MLPDRAALSACVDVADDHRILVAPACGAALAAVYGDMLRPLQKVGTLPQELQDVVVIVCGGNGVNVDSIIQWKEMLSKDVQ